MAPLRVRAEYPSLRSGSHDCIVVQRNRARAGNGLTTRCGGCAELRPASTARVVSGQMATKHVKRSGGAMVHSGHRSRP